MRRIFIVSVMLAIVSTTFAQSQKVSLDWLSKSTTHFRQGISWGVPWAKGTVKANQTFVLTTADGKQIPVQTWVSAYWQDGSVKWTGHAISADTMLKAPLTISVGKPVVTTSTLKVSQTKDSITINTGSITCRIAKQGKYLLESMVMGGKEIAKQGKLIAIVEDRSQYESQRITKEVDFESQIKSAIVEQSGSVRAVVKIEGVHKSATKTFLPFVMRLYFYSGQEDIKIVHSFIFDGNEQTDFIKGLGLSFGVPMREDLYNRHIRFAGETGMWAEPIKLCGGYRQKITTDTVTSYAQHLQGKPLPNLCQLTPKQQKYIDSLPMWDAFKLTQLSPNSYSIDKRTNAKSCWVHVLNGNRALGTAFLGDVSGGISLSLKNFWQKYPASFEVAKAGTSSAELKIWFWSPDANAMDLRHYDTKNHGLDLTYEDVEEGFSTPNGIANTSELTLRGFSSVPSNTELLEESKIAQQTQLLVCKPEYYHSIPVFGIWSLPDRSVPQKKWVEDQLDRTFDFYKKEIEQRDWYGFWNFGDIMHYYDETRHQWRYDIGGFAWNNTELMPDMWLWYSFLRTGREDIFRVAEAMTRHTQEVDVYHSGRFAGFGSRHNVVHWGCGAKEIRISQSFLKRFYYYLTTDERTGDLMKEVVEVDTCLVKLDPLRKIFNPTQYPTHARSGPDWTTFAGNWYTEWERTGDTKYRDKILIGMKSFTDMPKGLMTALSFAYDPKTAKMYEIPDQKPVGHFTMIFGGAEIGFELNQVIDNPQWKKTWLDLCEHFANAGTKGNMTAARCAAYVAYIKKDKEMGKKAWEYLLLDSQKIGHDKFPETLPVVDNADFPYKIQEQPWLNGTAGTSQWLLNAIEVMELTKDL